MSDQAEAVDTLANPQTAAEFEHRAWQYHAKKDQERAEADFRQALSLDNQSVDAQYGLAMVLKAMGKTEEAVEAFQRSIALVEETGESNRIRADMLTYLAKSHISHLKT